MLIRRLTANFGRLSNQTLELQDGLNILTAPNEAGKSTWCAFLNTMFYGIPSRERGLMADKNRYAPWDGSAMSGRLDCLYKEHELTIVRDSARAGAPMARFSATYSATADPVEALSGTNCGEILLGIPREVFERSAFIRQAGIAVGQDAELERRIVSLITTGEEDSSYSETLDALKKQLNRRKHNKTGLLPTLLAELDSKRATLSELHRLSGELRAGRETQAQLERDLLAVQDDLQLYDRLAAIEKKYAVARAASALQDATQQAELLASRLAGAPSNDEIARLRAAIVNLGTLQRSIEKAEGEKQQASEQLGAANDAFSANPFHGKSPEEAVRIAATLPQTQPVSTPALLLVTGGAAMLVIVSLITLFQNVPAFLPLCALAVALVLFVIGLFLTGKNRKHYRQESQLQAQYGTADRAEILQLAQKYAALGQACEAARDTASAAKAAYDSLLASLGGNEQAILAEVRRFAPAVLDLSSADSALRDCAVRRRTLADAEAAVRDAALRLEFTQQQAGENGELTEEERALSAPAIPQETLLQRKQSLEAQLLLSRSKVDQLSGRLGSLGDPAALEAEIAADEEQSARFEADYAAITLAIDALTRANSTLQTRFSPALGQHAAEIFSALTGGKYHKILLDRSFGALAEAVGDPLSRDARYLSQGTFDQLYLALRLAICDLVLPAENSVPLILDDALSNFDDRRMAEALQYLRSTQRQILLFSCHSREAAFFANDPTVSVQTLA